MQRILSRVAQCDVDRRCLSFIKRYIWTKSSVCINMTACVMLSRTPMTLFHFTFLWWWKCLCVDDDGKRQLNGMRIFEFSWEFLTVCAEKMLQRSLWKRSEMEMRKFVSRMNEKRWRWRKFFDILLKSFKSFCRLLPVFVNNKISKKHKLLCNRWKIQKKLFATESSS